MGRRQKHEEHENHERWLVSYADFITLLFAFFVVMYAISQVNESKYRVLSNALVNAFKDNPRSETLLKTESGSGQSGRINIKQQIVVKEDPAKVAKRQQQEEKMKNVATDLNKVMEPLVKDGKVRVTQSNRGIAVEINAAILFDPAEAKLNPKSVDVLKAVGQVLATIPNQVQVEGFTDNIPISTPLYPSNWELSSARASSVIRVFRDEGVNGDRLVAIGHAENKSVASNDTPDGRARNRRVTIMILAEGEGAVKELTLGGSSVSSDTVGQPAPVAQ